MLVPLALIPATLAYLGTDLFGLWMAIAALTGMAAFADLGLGNGLMTKLAPCYSNGDAATARDYISSAYLTLTGVALTACGLLWVTSTHIPWRSVFNLPDSLAESDARAIVLVCVTTFLVNIPLALITRIQYAYQMVGQSNLWQAVGNLASLPLAWASVQLEAPPAVLVAATLSGPVLANVTNSLWLFTRRPELAPRLGRVNAEVGGELLRLSGLFLALTVVTSVAINADNLIVAHTLGLASVAAFAVPARLFGQLGALITMVNTPLWPANGDALASGDLAWIRRTAKRMTLTSVCTVLVASVVLVLAGQAMMSAWLDVSLGTGQLLFIGLAIWWTLLASISPRFMVQNAAGVVRPQLLGWTAYLLLSVPAKWLCSRSLGADAIPYVGAVTYAITVIPSALYGYRKALTNALSTLKDAA